MTAEAADRPVTEADVVVVGYGGATAAITAHGSGARVVVLEKMPVGGGNRHQSRSRCLGCSRASTPAHPSLEGPVHYGHQIHEAMGHRDAGEVGV